MNQAKSKKAYPKSVRWRRDYDYLDKLPPEARKFLEEFDEAYYGASYSGNDWSPDERKAAGRAKNAAMRDLAGNLDRGVFPTFENESVNLGDSNTPEIAQLPSDLSSTPEYLSSPEYKARLAKFREHLDAYREVPPRKTWGYVASKGALEKCVARQDGGRVKVARLKAVASKRNELLTSIRGADGGDFRGPLTAAGFRDGDKIVVLAASDFEKLCREANALWGNVGEA